jgi:MraZ protein
MTQFLGTHTNRLDAKGRVSIPASFRAALKDADGNTGLILRPSHKHNCIEGWPVAAFNALAESMRHMPTFSDDQEDLALALYGEVAQLEPDREGRIVLPDELVMYANLKDAVRFIGLSAHFQIWEPGAAERRLAEAKARARSLSLPSGAQ